MVVPVRTLRGLSAQTNPAIRSRDSTKQRSCAREPFTLLHFSRLVSCWVKWSFLTVLVISQLLSVFWHSTTTHEQLLFGQNPLNGAYLIPGTNDEPYTYRMIVCMRHGRNYVPVQLSKALVSISAKVINTNGSAVHGYRVVQRSSIDLDPDTEAHYANTCDVIAATLVGISYSCTALGYNVTNDTLRIVVDVYSSTMKELQDSLPVLIMPYWDNAVVSRSVMPGWDGNACVHRLIGKYESAAMPQALVRGVTRSIRERKTVEWLKAPGGVWKNGWYEDPSGQRWYSDVQSSDMNSTYGIPHRQFDAEKNVEHDCQHTTDCDGVPANQSWGKFTITETVEAYTSVAVSNGSRYGLFLYESDQKRVVDTTYDLATFISNFSVVLMLVRWAVCMLALHNAYRLGLSPWYDAGLGTLSCARSFNMLCLTLLPRFKITLAAFWTVGGEFEGQQRALSDAWFVIYPAIAELMLFYYSLLNIVAKICRRRTSDVLFAPTMLFFCLWHYFRVELAYLFVDGRFSTIVLSREFESLTIVDLLTTETALRLCGGINSMLVLKVAVLAVSILPLLWSDSMTLRSMLSTRYRPCNVERTLAIRASNVGGFGRSQVYNPVMTFSGPSISDDANKMEPTSEERLACTLNCYEVIRLGYLVYGRTFLISFDDWYLITALSPLRVIETLWNHRILTHEVTEDEVGFHLSKTAKHCRLDDKQLMAIPFYDVTLCSFH
ncbi:TPA: hypothetical protein N0F65_010466 [Lagenidium giganteum]|uniref:Uncharacterized protein n=1 Tax=Lagenidium giganteum TaxID=4803 RepID=A0AAV2YKC0_9STRA|nr:TPA: hypothetical protein N0F65_010466 [Lagenidium giganteum]